MEAVGPHLVDLPVAIPVGCEDNLLPIQRPGGGCVISRVIGQVLLVETVGPHLVHFPITSPIGLEDDLLRAEDGEDGILVSFCADEATSSQL